MSTTRRQEEMLAGELSTLLAAGDGAVVTLVAGGTQLAAHRAVLVARSPVFAAMFAHDTQEAKSCRINITDVEGEVLQQLLAFLYTWQAPHLPSMAPQLLAAADKYDVAALKTQCEQQVLHDLSVENAAASAVLAVRHSCSRLREAAVSFIRKQALQVMFTEGWLEALRSHPDAMVELSRLVTADKPNILNSCSVEKITMSQNSAGYSRSSISQKEAEVMGKKLCQAAASGSVGDLRVLLAEGADVGVLGKYEKSALHWAAENGHKEAVSFLLQAGVTVDTRNKWGRTPLHYAVMFDRIDVVRLLLAASADINIRDMDGNTPLHMAKNAELVRVLLDAGADSSIMNKEGDTPLDIAVWRNEQELVAVLR